MEKFDLIVIGCGPGGEKAAVKAAYFGYKVAIVEARDKLGGEGVHAAIPSKALKETALFFAGANSRDLYGIETPLAHPTSIEQYMYLTNNVVAVESEKVAINIDLHGVKLFNGFASFVDAHTIEVKKANDSRELIVGENIIIATGTVPYHPPHITFDHKRIHDSDTILKMSKLPSSICIEGTGVIGCEYATIFNMLGIKVYLTNYQQPILPFLDKEILKYLLDQMTENGIVILDDHKVTAIENPADENQPLTVNFANGQSIDVELYLFATGRTGGSARLNCERAGVTIGKRGLIEVDSNYRTAAPNIYAIGDLIGGDAPLASTAMDQGRVAVAHIFNTHDLELLPKNIPCSIYTIPELAMIGLTEEKATSSQIPYCVGRSKYRDIARGKIMGAREGMLKIIFHRDSLEIVGVHIVGIIASELLHYGMTLVESKKTPLDVISAIFNFPTLHEMYKYASYDGLGNLSGHNIKNK